MKIKLFLMASMLITACATVFSSAASATPMIPRPPADPPPQPKKQKSHSGRARACAAGAAGGAVASITTPSPMVFVARVVVGCASGTIMYELSK